MNGIKQCFTIILTLTALLQVSGCSSPSAIKTTYIPDNIPPIPTGKARIVLTRPAKFAIHPLFIIVDTGTNIEANALMIPSSVAFYTKLTHPQKSGQAPENRESDISNRAFIEFFWHNPKKLDCLYIGESDGKKKRWRSLISDGFVTGNLNVFWENGSYYGIGSVREREINVDSLDNPTYRKIANELRGDSLISFMEDIRENRLEEVPTGTLYKASGFDPKKGFTVNDTAAVAVLGSWKHTVDPLFAFSQVQAIWEMDFGDTLIWDRAPGDMQLGAMLEKDTIFLQMPKRIKVEAGHTYYVDFHIETLGSVRWQLRKIE